MASEKPRRPFTVNESARVCSVSAARSPFVISLAGFSGATRWIAYATTPDGTEAIANGSIYIRALVSKYRAVVAAVEKALENYGNNPNKSIQVGELSITYKDYADLLNILAYWRSRAEADENGMQPKTGGVRFLKVRFD